jgi:hypothetical protein
MYLKLYQIMKQDPARPIGIVGVLFFCSFILPGSYQLSFANPILQSSSLWFLLRPLQTPSTPPHPEYE